MDVTRFIAQSPGPQELFKPFLQGKTALVTGSSSGIGHAMAHGLAMAGAKVMMHGIEPADKVEPLRAELERQSGVKIGYTSEDVSKADQVEEMVKKTEAELGPVDILVNNAGIQHVEALETFPDTTWEKIIAINLSAAFYASKHVFAGMKERGWGRIVMTSSAHGLIASPYKSAYVSAKHGIIGLAKVIALEGARHNITANAICPGYVWTPLVEHQIPDTAKARGITEDEVVTDVMLAEQPNKKFASDEQIGSLCVYLCSEQASSITGTALSIDGGWFAH